MGDPMNVGLVLWWFSVLSMMVVGMVRSRSTAVQQRVKQQQRNADSDSKQRSLLLDLKRKFFHLIAVLLFLPGILMKVGTRLDACRHARRHARESNQYGLRGGGCSVDPH